MVSLKSDRFCWIYLFSRHCCCSYNTSCVPPPRSLEVSDVYSVFEFLGTRCCMHQFASDFHQFRRFNSSFWQWATVVRSTMRGHSGHCRERHDVSIWNLVTQARFTMARPAAVAGSLCQSIIRVKSTPNPSARLMISLWISFNKIMTRITVSARSRTALAAHGVRARAIHHHRCHNTQLLPILLRFAHYIRFLRKVIVSHLLTNSALFIICVHDIQTDGYSTKRTHIGW